jgi:membrane fusion protein (multidrug efflux system)
VAQAELLRAETEAQKRHAAASAQALTISKLESEAKSKENNHGVRRAQLEREAASADGEIQTAEAGIKRFEHVVEQRRICAPVAGELGEATELRPGGFVTEGQKLGAIIPSGQLKLVAQFLPLTALGRVRSGQRARLRLDGFPWAQYGSVTATVSGVATEPRDGQLRVELAVRPESVPAVALQHGLTGTVEVEVERASPATLVLRAAGKILGAPRPVANPPL